MMFISPIFIRNRTGALVKIGENQERERNVLFNDALNTFYLRLYGIGLIVRKETHCRHIGYSYRLTARVLLYAPSHRQDSTYHGLCYTSRGALAGTRNSSMGPPHEGSIRRPIATWANVLPLSYIPLRENQSVFNKISWLYIPACFKRVFHHCATSPSITLYEILPGHRWNLFT